MKSINRTFEKEHFNQAFANNFYLSKEFLTFCSQVTGLKLKNHHVLKNKNISIHNYSISEKNNFKKNKISYMAVLPRLNKNGSSLIDYPIWFKQKSYKDAYQSYGRSFRYYLKKSKAFNFTKKIIRRYDKIILDQVYELYIQHMKRLNGPLFPLSFFEEFMKLKSSFLFLIYDKDKIISYMFCFENKDNLYTSIGAGHKDYFLKYINYLAYDTFIKYACDRHLNIHFGIGEYGKGYSKFKQRAGAVSFVTERYPNDEFITKSVLYFTKFKLTGFLARSFSKLFPKKLLYEMMPFT